MSVARFQKFLEFLLNNLFDVAAIALAAYLVIRHRFQPFGPDDIGVLATWILALLGLIAVSGLWDRHRRLGRIEKLSQESRDLVLRRLSAKVYAGDFFLGERRLSDETFATATTIWLAGTTLTRTTRDYMYALGQRLVAGVSIRIVILDPSVDSVMQEFALRSMGNTSQDYWRIRLQTVRAVIDTIAKTPGSRGKVELGYLPYIPSFGFVMIDPDKPHGFCFVELYHHKSAEPNPTFELRASDDPFWYSFFHRQYEILWNSCRVEALPTDTKSAQEVTGA